MIEIGKLPPAQDFIRYQSPTNINIRSTISADDNVNRRKYPINKIVILWVSRTTLRSRKIFKHKSVNLLEANGSIRSIIDWSSKCFGTDTRQGRSFEVIISSFLLTFYEEPVSSSIDAANEASPEREQYNLMKKGLQKLAGLQEGDTLRLLLHGPGGSGKSHVIKVVMMYAKEFCEHLNHPFSKRTIVVTALSGVAATLIGGETAHSAIGLNRGHPKQKEKDEWNDTRLLIIDEISLAGDKTHDGINRKTRDLTGNVMDPYGGIHIVFAGDYSQLEPVGIDPVYKDYTSLEENNCPTFIGQLNGYIELNGKWRFITDEKYGEVMGRFHIGSPTVDDISYINACLNMIPPKDVKTATYRNRNRDAINARIFDHITRENCPTNGDTLDGAIMIFMDELECWNSQKQYVPVRSNCVKKHFYEKCSEEDCSKNNENKARVDPVIKAYINAPFMMTKNCDVGNGQANGTRVLTKSVTMKAGECPFNIRLDNGTTILAAFASQVLSIQLEHEDPDIMPRTFDLKAERHNFECRMHKQLDGTYLRTKAKGKQFPIISNSATTGHKLQGSTLDAIYINDWHYENNWPYVTLSRVTTYEGLHIKEALKYDLSKYEKKETMKKMMHDFEEHLSCKIYTETEYRTMLSQCESWRPIQRQQQPADESVEDADDGDQSGVPY